MERSAFQGSASACAAELHALGEDDLLLCGQQRHAADLPQVEAHGVVRVEDLGRDGLGLGSGSSWRQARRRALGDGLLDRRAASASGAAAPGRARWRPRRARPPYRRRG